MPIPSTGVLLFFPPNNFGAIKPVYLFYNSCPQCTVIQRASAFQQNAVNALFSKICHQLFKVYLTFFIRTADSIHAFRM